MSNNHKSASMGQIHRVNNWEFVDASARTSFGYAATDAGKIARQVDDDSYWLVRSVNNGTAVFVSLTAVGTDLSNLVSLATTQAFSADSLVLSSAKAYTDEGLLLKADLTALANYTTTVDLNTSLGLKADLTALASYATTVDLNTSLANYTTTVDLNTSLGLKADLTALASYATTVDLNTSLGLKADLTALASYATSLALTDGLALKVDLTALNSTVNPSAVLLSGVGVSSGQVTEGDSILAAINKLQSAVDGILVRLSNAAIP